MEKLIILLKERMTSLVLPVAIFAGLIFPVAALADEEMALDVGHGRGGEGDPLDTNDIGGGDDPGDDVRDTDSFLDSGSDLIERMWRAGRIMIVPQYKGSILTIDFIILSDSGDATWGRNAK